MSPWFRFFNDALTDPRVRNLPNYAFRIWVDLLCIASLRDGDCGTVDDIVRVLRERRSRVTGAVAELRRSGLLSCVNDRYTPSDWRRRQYTWDQSTQRVRRFRQRQHEAASNSFPTVTETVQNRTEQRSTLTYPVAAREEEGAQQGREDWASDTLRDLLQGRRH